MTRKDQCALDIIKAVDGTEYTVHERKTDVIVLIGMEVPQTEYLLLSKEERNRKIYCIAVNVKKENDLYDWQEMIIFENLEEAEAELQKMSSSSDDECMKKIAEQLAKGTSVKSVANIFPTRLILPSIAAMINARPRIDEDLQQWALKITTRKIKPEKQMTLEKLRQIMNDAREECLF